MAVRELFCDVILVSYKAANLNLNPGWIAGAGAGAGAGTFLNISAEPEPELERQKFY